LLFFLIFGRTLDDNLLPAVSLHHPLPSTVPRLCTYCFVIIRVFSILGIALIIGGLSD
jgi:hypothetical protein